MSEINKERFDNAMRAFMGVEGYFGATFAERLQDAMLADDVWRGSAPLSRQVPEGESKLPDYVMYAAGHFLRDVNGGSICIRLLVDHCRPDDLEAIARCIRERENRKCQAAPVVTPCEAALNELNKIDGFIMQQAVKNSIALAIAAALAAKP